MIRRRLLVFALALALVPLEAAAGRNRNAPCPGTCDPAAPQPARIMATGGFVCVCGTGDFDAVELEVNGVVHRLAGELPRGKCKKYALAACSEDYVPARLRGRSLLYPEPWSPWSDPFEVFLQACPE